MYGRDTTRMGPLPPEMLAAQKYVSVTESPPIAGSHPAFSGRGVDVQRAFLPFLIPQELGNASANSSP